LLAHHETLMPLAAKLAPAHDVFFDLLAMVVVRRGLAPTTIRMQRQSRQHFCMVRRTLSAIRLALPWLCGLAVERPDLVSRVTLIEPVMFAAAGGATGSDVGPPARYSDGTVHRSPLPPRQSNMTFTAFLRVWVTSHALLI
jgi:hypothetical protein